MSSNPFISSGGAFTNLNQLQIHCSPYEWWVSLRSGYTHSRGKFSYDIENFTKSLYLRRLVQGNSCFLAGFLTFMIRDVFILLELLTCAWKCEFPQAPVCFWWQVDSLLPKISTFMKTWDLEFWNILSRNVWAPLPQSSPPDRNSTTSSEVVVASFIWNNCSFMNKQVSTISCDGWLF